MEESRKLKGKKMGCIARDTWEIQKGKETRAFSDEDMWEAGERGRREWFSVGEDKRRTESELSYDGNGLCGI